jgi:hypothetical protein
MTNDSMQLPNDIDSDQKRNTGRAPVDVTAQPQQAFLTANDVQFQPTPADIIGDMSHSPVLDRQAIDVRASGDMVSGGSGPGVERRPTIKGLP